MRYVMMACQLLLLLMWSAIGHAEAQRTEVHTASAYLDAEREQLVYTEKHTAYYDGDKLLTSINEYFDTEQNKIAELRSDYSRSLMMPEYVFENFRSNYSNGLKWRDGDYYIFTQETGEKEKSKKLKPGKHIFSGQGWHYYIIENLAQIKRESLKMNLVIPQRHTYYAFRVRPMESSDDVLHLRLEFDNWFMRLFVPHLDLYYDRINEKIARYHGPSNIIDASGDIKNVHIIYDYAGEGS